MTEGPLRPFPLDGAFHVPQTVHATAPPTTGQARTTARRFVVASAGVGRTARLAHAVAGARVVASSATLLARGRAGVSTQTVASEAVRRRGVALVERLCGFFVYTVGAFFFEVLAVLEDASEHPGEVEETDDFDLCWR